MRQPATVLFGHGSDSLAQLYFSFPALTCESPISKKGVSLFREKRFREMPSYNKGDLTAYHAQSPPVSKSRGPDITMTVY